MISKNYLINYGDMFENIIPDPVTEKGKKRRLKFLF